jgi:PST family polysaccharide transporter
MNKPVAPQDLSGNAARGVLWTGAGQLLRQIIQLGTSLILVRLLAPEDFGLLGMAMFFVGIGQLLADFGMGAAIMHSRSNDPVLLSSCFWLNLGVATLLAASLLLAAPLVAAFYRRTDLVPIMATLSATLLLSGLLVVPSALLTRDLRFGAYARAQVMGSLAGAIVAVAMAWRGFGVWALVAQPLFGTTMTLAATLVAAAWRPRFDYSWRAVRPLARFSAALLGTNLIGYANRNADNLLIGRVLGAGPLGHYAMAIQLMLYPLQQISSVFVRVLLPTLMHLQDDLARLRSAYLKTVSCIALLTFPIMGGLFAVADDFVPVVFGADWLAMVPVVKILAWVGMLQSVGTTVGTLYLSTGNPGLALRVTLVGTPVLIGGMAAGLPWGITGVAAGYATASFCFFFYSVRTAFRLIALDLRDFGRGLARPLISTLLMVALLLELQPVTEDWSSVHRLSVNVLIGVLTYCLVTFLIDRTQLLDLLGVLRSLRRAR